MPFGLSCRTDDLTGEVIDGSLHHRGMTSWRVNETDVCLPNPDNHVFIVFTHFLHHFFIEGVGLRQICDWCRMLWTYRDCLDYGLLEERIKQSTFTTEWKVFRAMAVEYLGIPVEAMPLYDRSMSYRRKARKVMDRVLKSGNF